MRFFTVYITTKDAREARKVGRALVRARLAACVNILGPIESVYRWEGRVRDDKEVALLAKTTARRLDALIKKVLSMHSYETPCIVALPIFKGNPAFLKWVEKETT